MLRFCCRPDIAAFALAEVLRTALGDIVVAEPREGTRWLDLH